jgi:hypothetical protein
VTGKPYVFATRRAVKDARALGVADDIAAAVRALVLAGRVVRDHQGGAAAWVALGDDWQARCEKLPRPTGPGRYWSVRAVERTDRRRRAA